MVRHDAEEYDNVRYYTRQKVCDSRSRSSLSSLMTRPSSLLQFVLCLIGFTSVIAQIVLMRELIVVFYGNEISLGIMLACWLFWTAVGSSVLGQIATRLHNSRSLVACLETLVAVAFPLTVFAVRASRTVFQSVPGEILGPVPMFLTSFVVLSVFCVLSGGLFAAGSRLLSSETGTSTASAASSVYLVEAAGSGLGGILASLVLIRYFGSFEIAIFLGLLNLLAAVWVGVRGSSLRRILPVGLLIAGFLIAPAARLLEAKSLALLWRGFTLVESRNSVYGNLALAATGDSRSLFENGLRVLTAPDPVAAEEAVHFALLEHPSPRSLLLIGGGINGSLAQALQYSSLERVEYVELDPAILGVAERHFSREWSRVRNDRRVRIHRMDGRLFLKTEGSRFDVIVIDLPDPHTAQLNRFYTREFFSEAAEKLNPGGVLSFQVTAAENYISQELSDLLACLQKTLGVVFPQVAAIPGGTVHFLASNRAGALTLDPTELMARLHARGIRTEYLREYYLPFRMSPDRMADLEMQIEPQPTTAVNRDLSPIAYYYDVVLWGSRFHSGWRTGLESLAQVKFATVAGTVAIALLGLALGVGFYEHRRDVRYPETSRHRATAGLCVAAMGFTLLGLEVLLLLGFQALYGYVYQQLAILVALFMAGMAVGAWLSLKRASARCGALAASPPGLPAAARAGTTLSSEFRSLAVLQLLAALAPFLLCALFRLLEGIRSAAALLAISQIVFPVLALLAGLMGGYQFPLASRIYLGGSNRNPGILYGLDLVGACLGAVALSAYLLPVFGFLRTAALMALMNLAPAALAASGQRAQRSLAPSDR